MDKFDLLLENYDPKKDHITDLLYPKDLDLSGINMVEVANNIEEIYEMGITDQPLFNLEEATTDQGFDVDELLKRVGIKNATKKAIRVQKQMVMKKRELRKEGFNFSKLLPIKKLALKSAYEITEQYQAGNPKQAAIIMNKSLHKAAKLTKSIFDVEAEHIPEALYMVLMTILVSVFFEIILMMLFGPMTGAILGGVLIAPLVEERATAISIEKNIAGEFLLAFNALEFFTYIIKGAPIIVRLIAAGFHYFLAWIQKRYSDDGNSDFGYFLAVTLHSLWNFLAIMSAI